MNQWNSRTIFKMTNVLCIAVFLFCVCTACTEPEANLPSKQGYPITEDFVLSLQAGNQLALLSGTLADGSTISGQEISLSVAPFIEDGTFFFPLQDIVTALGGSCNIQGNYARIQLFDRSIVYQVGSNVMSIDGISYQAANECRAFSGDDTTAPVVLALPCLRDGVFFLPDSFRPQGGSSTGLDIAAYAPTLDLLILGYQLQNETTIDGISVGELDRYQDLPKDIQTQFQQTQRISGDAAQGEWYDILVYEKKGIMLYVMDVWPDSADDLNGTICGIQVNERGFQSARGLQVGDSSRRAELLYGVEDSLNLTNRIQIDEKNGTVTSFCIFSRFWGPD